MTYYGLSRKAYTLIDPPIKKGGEGAIHQIQGESGLLAKIYLDPGKTPELQEKITLMMQNPPKKDILDQIAWPIDVIFDPLGNFAGFVMPKLSIDVELGDVYKYPPKKNITLTVEQKVIVAINICRVIAAIHDLGYVFGDFNPCNIGVNLTTGHVAFLDTDSYHITDRRTGETYRCTVCLNGYVAPELIKKCKNSSYAKAALPTFTKETDLFSLAIHVFKLLMNGFTPYNGIPENRRSSTASPGVGNAAIEMDNYCFKAGNKPLSVAVLPLKAFPQSIQTLFSRAFDEGHADPSKRPDAKEWDAALTGYLSSLKKCSANPLHHHYNALKTCPYCEADSRYNMAMSLSAVYGTSSGSPASSSGQISFAQPVTPPPAPKPATPKPAAAATSTPRTSTTTASASTSTSTSRTSATTSTYTPTVRTGITPPPQPQRTAPSSSYGNYSSGTSSSYSSRKKKKKKSGAVGAVIIILLIIGALGGGIFGIVRGIQNGVVNKMESIIEKLPNNPSEYLDYHDEIMEAYEAYTKMSDKLKGRVENSAKLFACIEKLDAEKELETRQSLEFNEAGGGYSVRVKDSHKTTLKGEVKIPESYKGLPVITIPKDAFNGCTGVTSIIIPDSVTTIEEGALRGCSGLRELTVPFIGGSASATDNSGRIGYIFGRNEYAGSVEVNFDGGYPNYTCHLPAGLTKVEVTNATSIAARAFSNCTQLTEIKLNEGIISVYDYAFYNCNQIKEISLPSVLELGKGAFENCKALEKFTINDHLTKLPNYCFKNCSSLSSINSEEAGSFIIPDTITSIGEAAFSGCTLMTKITLPFVGGNATATDNVGKFGYIFGKDEYAGSVKVNFDGGYPNYTCYLPARLKEVVITSATQIAFKAFGYCETLEVITLNPEIISVGDYAFVGCKKISTISIPGALTIGKGSFENCNSLKSFTLNSNISVIPAYAFKNCIALEKFNSETVGEFIVPATVTSIGEAAFSGCTSMTKLTVPFVGGSSTALDNTGRFGYIFGKDEYAGSVKVNFDGGYPNYTCYLPANLKTVVVTNATQIAPKAFSYCSHLTSITLNSSVKNTIGADAFRECVSPKYK